MCMYTGMHCMRGAKAHTHLIRESTASCKFRCDLNHFVSVRCIAADVRNRTPRWPRNSLHCPLRPKRFSLGGQDSARSSAALLRRRTHGLKALRGVGDAVPSHAASQCEPLDKTLTPRGPSDGHPPAALRADRGLASFPKTSLPSQFARAGPVVTVPARLCLQGPHPSSSFLTQTLGR